MTNEMPDMYHVYVAIQLNMVGGLQLFTIQALEQAATFIWLKFCTHQQTIYLVKGTKQGEPSCYYCNKLKVSNAQ